MQKRKIIILITAILLIVIMAELILSNCVLTVKNYSVKLSIQGENEIKIVQITDYHAGSSLITAKSIINKTAQLKPNIIAVTGDMLDEYSTEYDISELLSLLIQLNKIAPVYYSLGNHERTVIINGRTSLCDEITSTGATLLDNSYKDITINGKILRIGGMLDEVYHFYYTKSSFNTSNRAEFLLDFNNTSAAKIMLCHRPDSLNNYSRFNVSLGDLVLCGHTHGGVIRIPFGPGVFAPDFGWFNPLSYGKHTLNDTQMIVCSGLDGYKSIPRLLNPCEICLITIS